MLEIRIIDVEHKQDINIPNEPFLLFGRMIPSYTMNNGRTVLSVLGKMKSVKRVFQTKITIMINFQKPVFLLAHTIAISALVLQSCNKR